MRLRAASILVQNEVKNSPILLQKSKEMYTEERIDEWKDVQRVLARDKLKTKIKLNELGIEECIP